MQLGINGFPRAMSFEFKGRMPTFGKTKLSTGYKCWYCGQVYTRARHLTRHYNDRFSDCYKSASFVVDGTFGDSGNPHPRIL